jgi:hypothetical protein
VLAVLRAQRVAELVVLRLSLPSRLAREPLDTLLAGLTPVTRAPTPDSASALHRRDLLRVERGVARLPWVPSTCLYRALARYALLRRHGVPAVFVMGLGAEGVKGNGHAWIELEGLPFEEPDDVTRYAVTFRYPSASTDGNVSTP